jgi:hypothetical protein
MSYGVTASVDEGSSVSGVRHDEQSALQLALAYRQQGFANIQISTEDASYSLNEFRLLVD